MPVGPALTALSFYRLLPRQLKGELQPLAEKVEDNSPFPFWLGLQPPRRSWGPPALAQENATGGANMPATLDEMVSKGTGKLTRKAPSMKTNYDAAKTDMKTSYGELPFGPNVKSDYNKGIDGATYRAPDPTKWGRNWRRKISR